MQIGKTVLLDLGDTQMRTSKLLLMLCVAAMATNAEPNECVSDALREQLRLAKTDIPADILRPAVLGEPMNFVGFAERYRSYGEFSIAVSNCWREALSNFASIATNAVDRLLLLGVGEQFEEDFYIDYMNVVSELKTNGVITASELKWIAWSPRSDLLTCIRRRYREPKVMMLVDKYKVSMQQHTNYWNDVLSGAAYTNYLEEVEAGLWQ